MTGEIRVKLTEPQERFFHDVIKAGTVCGDCDMEGLTLVFREAVAADIIWRRMVAKAWTNTREYVMWDRATDKVQKAIQKWRKA